MDSVYCLYCIYFLFRISQQAEATWTLQQEELSRDAKRQQFSREKSNNYAADITHYEVCVTLILLRFAKIHDLRLKFMYGKKLGYDTYM